MAKIADGGFARERESVVAGVPHPDPPRGRGGSLARRASPEDRQVNDAATPATSLYTRVVLGNSAATSVRPAYPRFSNGTGRAEGPHYMAIAILFVTFSRARNPGLGGE